ncbi:hypothetical protein MVES1_002387 [Malassezia vespertilionis]|nr:uncharacterized protein MVES1_002387 [Malassezia vespertilionis]WFD07031.1 hypothetical protein MVES1_002387 [Malassezia vespertilionis]
MHVQRIVDGVHLLARLYPDVWGKHVWDEASVLASDAVAQLLDKLRQMQSSDTEQVRASLRIASNGETRVVLGNMAPASSEIYPVRLDTQPTLVDTPYVYVKTDQRSLYDEARARVHGNLGAPGASSSSCFDVLMWHEEAHACVVTESSIANVILEIPGAHGQLYTPTCTALLPGLLLQELCARGAVTQREITVDALHEALRSGARLWLCNAVRGMFQVALV